VITPHDEYSRLGRDHEERRYQYRALFQSHLDPVRLAEIRDATNGNYALGGDRFKAEIAQVLNRRATRGKNGRPARQERRD
jgi:putative transposase